MSLIIDINVNDSNINIKPKGEIDIYTSPIFKEKVLNAFDKNDLNIIIDGENLDYIDSTGLVVLISIYKVVKEKDKNILILI